MSFSETTILSTREPSFGARKLGQIIAVPTGRVDKVSVYLEPQVSDADSAASVDVKVELFMVDSGGIPAGPPVATDVVPLSDIKSRGFVNFRLETTLPSVAALVVSTFGGTADDHVAWRYVSADASGEELLISEDDGATWAQDSGRKFAFVAYSTIDDVVDADDQSAEIQAGKSRSIIDDTAAEFSLSELTRASVSGDTVVIDFGDFVVTLVVDMSGSMTWNDNGGLRFDFLREYIDDMEDSLPPESEATYSLVKFRSRKVGSLETIVQTGEESVFIEGVRVVRKVGSVPTGPSDGLIVFEGLARRFEDSGLTSGTLYGYGIFVQDSEGNFSDGKFDSAIPQSPASPPLSTASLRAEEVVDLVGGEDIGRRFVSLTWAHPEGLDYDKITLARRSDRPPESPTDGTVIFTDTGPSLATSFTDFDPDSPDRADHAITGLTYYYSIFTEDTGTELKSLGVNARQASVEISIVDRIWERAEPPFDTPPSGFDDTAPLPPAGVTATPGPGEILLSWTAGNDDNRRYQVFFKEREFPKATNTENGFSNFDGEKIFDGTATSFAHRGLSNDQPHFYVIVSLDEVSNQSSPVQVIGRPSTDADAIPPDPVGGFEAEVLNGNTNLLKWDIDISRVQSVDAFFGDTVRLTAVLDFDDTDPRETSAEFSFVEQSRRIRIFDEDGSPSDNDGSVSDELSLIFDQAPATGTNTINADVSVTPFTSIQNQISDATLSVRPAVQVKDRATGEVLTEVIGRTVTITFNNPFSISILNDPPQTVNVRSINESCSLGSFPEIETNEVDGVFARSGDSFLALLESKFRGAALPSSISLSAEVLDANSGEVSTRLRLPETGSDGVAVLATSNQVDEILDRTGSPTGDTVERTVSRISLPAQDLPGEFIIEVTGSFSGFSRTIRSEVRYVSSLNIDVKSKPFVADGVNIAEQEAFVYFGDPLAPDSEKVAVPDLTVTDWKIAKISGGGPDTRPFFSRDSVPGTGIKSFVREGVARNVFFGPGTDIEPPETVECTDGELYTLLVTAEALGMEGEGFGILELLPFEPTDLKSLFLRLSKDQTDEFGNATTVSNLANHAIFADGSQESAWEVVARPEEDTESGLRSGVDFRDKVVANGGVVPSLEDGTIISIVIQPFSDSALASDVIIRTDLTGPAGRAASAKATVVGGKAKFSLSGNFLVSGNIKDPPLVTEVGNPIFPTGSILWTPSSMVFGVSVHTVLEINGRPSIFSGGGADLGAGTPPAYLSFLEPLEAEDPEE